MVGYEEIILAILGSGFIGGIIGSYLQHFFREKRETSLRIQSLNEGKYRSTLIFMRCVLKPENVSQFNIPDPNIKKLKSDAEVKKFAKERLIEFYYNSLLYASDEVLLSIKEFLENPTETNLMKSAIAMRKDLWKKETKATLETLSLE